MQRIKIYVIVVLVFAISLAAESFSIGRLKYGGGGDWYSNPTSINNLLEFIALNTNVHCDKLEKSVEIMDGTLFDCPYLYLTGHGNIQINDKEVEILRRHLLNGGFLHADDNYGLDKSFRKFVKKLFPDKELKPVPFDHAIYRIKYKFSQGLPKIHKHDGLPPQGLGIFDKGRLVLFYSFESDLGDGWEDIEVHKDPQEKRIKALQMGCNLVLYYLNS